MSPSISLQGKQVVVLMGGPGKERDVSLRSGQAVIKALLSIGIKADAVDIYQPPCVLPKGVDLAFNMIHGTYGEDGRLQKELEELGIAYTGEGVEGSRIAFDKIESKRAFEKCQVPTPEWEIIHKGETPSISLPYVVKSPKQGSSVGVHIIHQEADFPAAMDDCLQYGEEVLIERFIEGRELTVGVLGEEALPVIEIRPHHGFYNYENKYTTGATEYLVPAPISEATTKATLEMALQAHRALGLEIYSRVDFLLSKEGSLYVLEINTIPGMTATSLLPKAAAVRGLSFAKLCERIGILSLERRHSQT